MNLMEIDMPCHRFAWFLHKFQAVL